MLCNNSLALVVKIRFLIENLIFFFYRFVAKMFMWDWFTGMLNYLGKFENKFEEQK